jgi:2-dehydropantoate 2-reductase
VRGDVLFLHNWAAGAAPLGAAIGLERVLLGFPVSGAGTMDGDVVRPRPAGVVDRLARMPVGEPDGRTTPRLRRVVGIFRAAGIGARAEPRMEAWLRTHAAFEVPLGQAVHAAGGPLTLADDPVAIREMAQRVRESLGAVPSRAVPRAFDVVRALPERMVVALLPRFLRSPPARPLGTASPAAISEYERLAEQLAAA